MPKVKYLDPPELKALSARLAASEGHLCSLSAVGRIIGYKNVDCIKRWLSEQGIPARSINGKLRYDTYDIARKLVEARI